MPMLKKFMVLSTMAASMLFAGHVSAKFSDLYIEAKVGTCTQKGSCGSTALDLGYEWNKQFSTEIGAYVTGNIDIPDLSTDPEEAKAWAGYYAAAKLTLPLQSKFTPYAKLGYTKVGYARGTSNLDLNTSVEHTMYSAIGTEYRVGKRFYVLADASYVPHEDLLALMLGIGF